MLHRNTTQNPQNNSPQRSEHPWSDCLYRLFFFCAVSIYVELCLHLCVFRTADRHLIYPFFFGAMVGAGSALVIGLLPRIPRRILAFLLVLGQCLLANIQLVYHAVFGNLMPITQLAMGGAVVENFLDQTLYGIRQNLGQVLLLLVPLFLLILVFILKKAPKARTGWKQSVFLVLFLAAAAGTTIGMMKHCPHPISVLRVFRDAGTSTDMSYRNVGMTATTFQELRYALFPPKETTHSLPVGEQEGGEEQRYSASEYNVLPELDFTALAASTEDPSLQALDRYFAAKEPTKKNEYTGRLKGYNIIELCAESFSPLLVSEELTPTLYRMTHSGIVFDNYYGCFNSVTTNGEYTFCLGLLPDMTRTKTQSSFDESVGHYYPFCLGTILKNYGYSTLAYHNNQGEFYNRSLTHPNMGYTFKAQGSGLNVTPQSPASDLEMMEQSIDDYLNSDRPFHAYYMTYSGHFYYNWDNDMSGKHQAECENLPYSETVQAYIACNLELEDALTYLEQRLTEAGKLDSTVIVLTNDHYPYGLTDEEYNELAGKEVDVDFEKYRNTCMCYVPGLGETVHVSEYCSTVDILPTLLNLLGISYDSRLLPGTDVLAPGSHAALLQDGSVITSDFRYCESTGTLVSSGGEVSQETLEAARTWADTCFTVSREILNTDYYSHVFPGDHEVVEAEELPFHDSSLTIGAQANILFIYRKGLVDLYEPDRFRPKKPATLGDWVTAVYRYLGSPDTDETALPPDYPSADPEAQTAFRASKHYHAVCWAFSAGLLRPEDRMTDYSLNMDNVVVCLMMYRTVEMLGRDDLSVEPENLETFPGNTPNVTEDEKYAVAWALQHIYITGGTTTKDTLFDELPQNTVNRYRLVLFLMHVLYPEISR